MNRRKILCYVTLFILLSADRLAFIYKPTIRVSQVFYPIAFLYLAKRVKLRFSDIACFMLLILYSAAGEIWTYNFFKTSLYVIWLVYNYFFVYVLFYAYSSELLKDNVMNRDELFLIPCRVYIIICILILIVNNINHSLVSYLTYGESSRIRFFSYEPSYCALFLSPYCALVFYKYATEKVNNMHYFDFALLIGAFIAIKSSTLIMTFAFCMAGLVLISKISLKRLCIFLVILLSALYIFYMNQYASFFITRLFERGLIASGQGRYEATADITLKVFRENLLLGVGIGGYGGYIGDSWAVAMNVTIELLAELGIIGTAIFILWILPSIPREKKYLFSAIIFFLTYQGSQNYMRLHFWALLGIWRAINNFDTVKDS